jgi:23S rRNA pseudouridine2605 synthase
MNPTDPDSTDRPAAAATQVQSPSGESPAPASGEQANADQAAAGPADAPTDGEGREPRRRRRNRRRGRKGDRAEGTPAQDAGDEADEAAAASADAPPVEDIEPAPLEKTDPNEVFGAVLSGAFDESVATEGEEQPAQAKAPPARRVLAPEADAPKLHKVLAQSGVGSRRDLEQMIAEGRVSVNGQPAHTGQRISFGDRIAVDGKPVKVRIAPPPPRVIAYHKPAGEVVTHDDPQQRPTVFRRLPRLPQGKWQSVGRLDINTEGLLLFTNSGDLANRLMHPRFGVEREYAVRILGVLSEEGRARLLEGVEIDGLSAAFRSIEDGGGDGANRWYRVVITEGRNREVRKLFDSVGHAVSRLIRIRYGSVVLPKGLRRGVWVDLAGEDVKALRFMTTPGPRQGADGGQARGGPNPDGRGRKNPRRGRSAGKGAGGASQALRAAPDGDFAELDNIGPIPNPLQQTYDKRAIQQARRVREMDDDGPIPNPLQQTYDKRAVQADARPRRVLDEDGPIPNPLQQTYDKRFVKPVKASSGPGGGGGGGRPRKKPAAAKGGASGAAQPDPMRTSVGYIGADAFHQKGKGGRGGKGGRSR